VEPQHKTRRQFSKQFKAETVALIRSSGKSVPQVFEIWTWPKAWSGDGWRRPRLTKADGKV